MNNVLTPVISNQHIAGREENNTYITIVQIPLRNTERDGDPGYNEVRNAIIELSSTVDDDVRIRMEYREYDCTGQIYTTGLELLKRFVHQDEEGYWLIGIYLHHTSMDV